VTTQGPGGQGTPEERDGTLSASEEVWLKFLTDSEGAIRGSAPREPSARERAPGRHPRTIDADRTERRSRYPHEAQADCETDAVGELWQPDDPRVVPTWRELDGRARLRRVGRVIVTAAAITLALGAWSWLSTSADAPGERPHGTIVQQMEDAPHGQSPATRFPPGSAVAEPSPSAIPAG
jgi:hypothetical protein